MGLKLLCKKRKEEMIVFVFEKLTFQSSCVFGVEWT